MKIHCKVSDEKIWNTEEFIIGAIKSIQTDQALTVDFRGEGPCCRSLGLDKLLDQIVDSTGIDPNQILIETGNYLSSSEYKQKIFPKNHYNITKTTMIPYAVAPWQNFDTRFGIFIGRSNWIRLGLASYVWNHFRDQSLITFHYDSANEFHRANFGLENLLTRHHGDRQQVFKFIEHLPLTLGDEISYPITIFTKNSSWNLLSLYDNFFCEIVCETFFTGDTFFMTEKIFRPIIAKRPFLLQGPTNFLKNLRALGFKTFANWWDEGYDEDPGDARYETFKFNIDYIARQSDSTLNAWYNEMQPILEHNYQVLQTLTNQKILSVFYNDQ